MKEAKDGDKAGGAKLIQLNSMSAPSSHDKKSKSTSKLKRSDSIENIVAGRSPTKRTSSKLLDGKSPTKKSVDYLISKSLKNSDDFDVFKDSPDKKKQSMTAEQILGVTSPGLRKYTRDISDVAGKKLPHIVSKFIDHLVYLFIFVFCL